MQPKPNSFFTNNQNNLFPGKDYLSHSKQDYLTPGQKAFLAQGQFNGNPNSKENNHFLKWNNIPNNAFNKNNNFNCGNQIKSEGFRSNTGQYNSSYEDNKGPMFMEFNSRHSFFNEDKTLDMKIQEQEFEFSRMSNVPQNFQLEYVEYDHLPHVSQLTPGFSK
jgi:hypothetical protein